jgi:hypothetical protein
MKSLLWKALHNRWQAPPAAPTPGYSMLMLMPGDLPFFLDIFLRVFAGKRTEHLVEALVLPDLVPPGFRARFDRFRERWPHGDVRLVTLKPVDQFLVKMVKNPHANCWLQLVNGVNAARATHAFFHDADLFVKDPDFFESSYERCARERLACLGLSPAWDPWYRENGLGHVTATWELLFDLAWLRGFKPWQHRGHDGVIQGRLHTHDITFLPQSLTPAERISRHEDWTGFVHFNYVICTYRHFQHSHGPFEDDSFRILLLRLLIDAFDPGDWKYDAPPLDELVRGLDDPSRRVTYRARETAGHYNEFRGKMQNLLDSTLLSPDQAGRMARGIEPFDRAFGMSARPLATAS